MSPSVTATIQVPMRDWFAGIALSVVVPLPPATISLEQASAIAMKAYVLADAMMAERSA